MNLICTSVNQKMETKTFYFKIQKGDLYSGPRVDNLDINESDEDFDEEYDGFEIDLSLPDNNYISYVISEACGFANIITQQEFDRESDAELFLLQTYSLINDCTPFIVPGLTSANKEKGYYGKAIPLTFCKLKKLNIDNLEYDKIFGVIISKDGYVSKTLSIVPPE